MSKLGLRKRAKCWRVCVFLGALSVIRTAAASPGEVLVVPAYANGAQGDALRALAMEVDAELERTGVRHRSSANLAEALPEALGVEPRPFTEGSRKQFVAEAQKGLDAVTKADWVQALQHLQRAIDGANAAIESANRSPRTAEQIFQACLLSVQVMAEQGDRAGAMHRATFCLRQSPGMAIEGITASFAPIVKELLDAADTQIVEQAAAAVNIESQPAGCVVRLNGRALGTTPLSVGRLARIPYRVQVECGEEPSVGRVHVITPGDRPTRILAGGAVESALRTDGEAVSLRHSEPSDANLRDHVYQLVRACSARSAIAVGQAEDGRFWLMHVGDERSALVHIDEHHSRVDLASALRALLSETPPRTDVEPHRASSNADLEPSNWWKPAAIAGSAVVGAGALVASYALHARQVRAGDEFQGTADGNGDDSVQLARLVQRGRAWSSHRRPPYAFAGFGAGALAGAATGLSMAGPKLPWWITTVTGVAAGGLVAWGALDMAKGGHCGTSAAPIQRACVDGQDRRDRGGLVLLSSVPFIPVFGGQLVRTLFGQDDVVLIQPHAERAGGGVDFAFRI